MAVQVFKTPAATTALCGAPLGTSKVLMRAAALAGIAVADICAGCATHIPVKMTSAAARLRAK